MIDPLFQLVLAVALAALFAAAAAHKWTAAQRMDATLADYGVPGYWTGTLRAGIATVETAIALALVLPDGRSVGGWAACALLLGYAIVLALAIGQGRAIVDCGCTLGIPQRVERSLVVRNLVLASFALLLMLPATARPLGPVDVFVAAAAVATLGLLYGAIGTLLANQPRTRELAGGHDLARSGERASA